ncbi:MAG: peptide deformylase [Deltaproteobacteria bacterium]|nr:peptide deformylase [Deltaproteobacteria bacterium]
MAVLPVVTFPDPVLRQRCKEVTAFDADLHKLLDDMGQTMATAEGIGLAANQVGDLRRLFLMDVHIDDNTRTGLLEIVNPRIVAKRGEVRFEEGCLSFPGVFEFVVRANEIELHYQDRTGAAHKIICRGMVAICAQHEYDHLEGVTFIDRLSPLKRQLALRDYDRRNREALDDKTARAKARARRQPPQQIS